MVSVGNLDTRRDITDVRDVVRAYATAHGAWPAGRPYNICRGEAHRIGDLLEIIVGLARTRVEVRMDSSLVRPRDNLVFLGNPSRIARGSWLACRDPDRADAGRLLDDWRHPTARRS